MKKYWKQINELMDAFDFEWCQDVMEQMQWQWMGTKNGVPSVEEIKENVRRMLEDLSTRKNCEWISSGGYAVSKQDNCLKIEFIPMEASVFIGD